MTPMSNDSKGVSSQSLTDRSRGAKYSCHFHSSYSKSCSGNYNWCCHKEVNMEERENRLVPTPHASAVSEAAAALAV